MPGPLSSAMMALLLLGFNALAAGCQTLISTYLHQTIPLNIIDIILLVIGILIVIHSPLLLLAAIGVVALYCSGY
jgi:hypothetical protein